jgi:hypothetical protein
MEQRQQPGEESAAEAAMGPNRLVACVVFAAALAAWIALCPAGVKAEIDRDLSRCKHERC